MKPDHRGRSNPSPRGIDHVASVSQLGHCTSARSFVDDVGNFRCQGSGRRFGWRSSIQHACARCRGAKCGSANGQCNQRQFRHLSIFLDCPWCRSWFLHWPLDVHLLSRIRELLLLRCHGAQPRHGKQPTVTDCGHTHCGDPAECDGKQRQFRYLPFLFARPECQRDLPVSESCGLQRLLLQLLLLQQRSQLGFASLRTLREGESQVETLLACDRSASPRSNVHHTPPCSRSAQSALSLSPDGKFLLAAVAPLSRTIVTKCALPPRRNLYTGIRSGRLLRRNHCGSMGSIPRRMAARSIRNKSLVQFAHYPCKQHTAWQGCHS